VKHRARKCLADATEGVLKGLLEVFVGVSLFQFVDVTFNSDIISTIYLGEIFNQPLPFFRGEDLLNFCKQNQS